MKKSRGRKAKKKSLPSLFLRPRCLCLLSLPAITRPLAHVNGSVYEKTKSEVTPSPACHRTLSSSVRRRPRELTGLAGGPGRCPSCSFIKRQFT